MEGEAFFLDTYAIYEIAGANPDYRKFSGTIKIVTTKLNLMEAHYNYPVRIGKNAADIIFDGFSEYCVEINDDDYKNAMLFRADIKTKNPKSNISYIDAVAYTIAERLRIIFVTGDKEFKGMENVEFIK